MDEIAAAEREVARGRIPRGPFVLVAQRGSCSMKRERRVVSTRSGPTVMFRSTAARICRIKSNRRSNDSRPVFGIASARHK